MTTAELITAVRDQFGEDSTSATQISDTQILGFLNRRQKELCADTNSLVSGWTASTVKDQQTYTVPPEYTSVEAIRLYQTTGQSIQWWLDKVEMRGVDPRLASGAPERFSVWALNVSGDNTPAFWLDPIPSTSGSSDLVCFGRQLPKTMVSGGQAPEVRERWQIAIVDGAVMNVYRRLAAGDTSFLPLFDRAQGIWREHKAEAEEQAAVELDAPRMVRDVMGYTRPFGYGY